jgi:hypothetical protein
VDEILARAGIFQGVDPAAAAVALELVNLLFFIEFD